MSFGANAEFLNGGLADATTYYYKFKSVDYSGNKSEFTAEVSATTNAAAISGSDGPRNAAGYVYYSLSSDTAPSSPSATSYNFSTGAFGGLTSNWSRTPPTNTGGDAKYWATSYYVTEATFGGTQTLTFGAPFASFQFDGLVTFTNLNTELANASSTEITTINGGLVTTGTIEADRVRIDGVGIDVVTDGTEKSLVIGDAGVTTVKIDDLAVSSAKIANLAVTEGKIANLAVDTLKIADRAVTLPNSAFTSSEISVAGNDGLVTIQTVSYTTTGSPVNISASCYYYGDDDDSTSDDVQLRFRILRNGTLIGAITPIDIFRFNSNGQKTIYPFSISVKDTPASGTVTYTFVADVPSVSANPNCKIGNRSLVTLEVKK